MLRTNLFVSLYSLTTEHHPGVIVELKYDGAGGMSVSVDGKREEVFGTDMDRSRPVAAYNNGKLFPFLTCYGPQTSVRILQS